MLSHGVYKKLRAARTESPPSSSSSPTALDCQLPTANRQLSRLLLSIQDGQDRSQEGPRCSQRRLVSPEQHLVLPPTLTHHPRPQPHSHITHRYDANGVKQPEDASLGYFPDGIIQYNPSGFMSALLYSTRDGHRPASLTWPAKPENQTEHDWAQVGIHQVSYAGPFHISNLQSLTDGQVHHGPLVVAGIDSWVGTTVTRNFTILDRGRWLLIKIVGASGNLGLSYWQKVA